MIWTGGATMSSDHAIVHMAGWSWSCLQQDKVQVVNQESFEIFLDVGSYVC